MHAYILRENTDRIRVFEYMGFSVNGIFGNDIEATTAIAHIKFRYVTSCYIIRIYFFMCRMRKYTVSNIYIGPQMLAIFAYNYVLINIYIPTRAFYLLFF